VSNPVASRIGHAQHVGSLVRPEDVVRDFMRPLSAQPLTPAEQADLQDRVARLVRANVKLLGRTGLPLTSGEAPWLLYLSALGVLFQTDPSGFAPGNARTLPWHRLDGQPTTPVVDALVIPGLVGSLKPTGESILPIEKPVLTVADELGLRGPTMVSIPSVLNLAMGYRPGLTSQTLEEVFAIATWVMVDTAAQLAHLGFTIVKVDDPIALQLGDPKVRAELIFEGLDPDELLERGALSDNRLLQAIKAEGAVAALHLCNGNALGYQIGDTGLENISNILPGTQADAFFVEALPYLEPNWELLGLLPRDTLAVLGLISSKDPQLEDPKEVIARITAAARHRDLASLAVSPQCGFASHVLGNNLTADEQAAKLGLVVKIADEVWGKPSWR